MERYTASIIYPSNQDLALILEQGNYIALLCRSPQTVVRGGEQRVVSSRNYTIPK